MQHSQSNQSSIDHIMFENSYKTYSYMTADSVRGYFSIHGEIADVKVTPSSKIGPDVHDSAEAVVKFCDASSAYLAIAAKPRHIEHGLYLDIVPYFSWEQPNAYKLSNADDNSMVDEPILTISKNRTNLLALDDDSLEKIFSYLTLQDQINFLRVCPRLRNVFEMYTKHAYKTCKLDVLYNLTLWELRDFFTAAGASLECLVGRIPSEFLERYMYYILKYSPRLKTLNMMSVAIKDDDLEAITKLEHMENLILSKNTYLTGKHIDRFKNLKQLEMYDCDGLEPGHLVKIITTLSNLTLLDIQRCEILTTSMVDLMVEHLPKLEVFKFSIPPTCCSRLALLPSLKKLDILSSYEMAYIPDELFEKLVEHRADQLERLCIISRNAIAKRHIDKIIQLRNLRFLSIGNNDAVDDEALQKLCQLQKLEILSIKDCHVITDRALLSLVKSCPRLHIINIDFCFQISIKFVIDALTFLRNNKDFVERDLPLEFPVRGTRMESGIKKRYANLIKDGEDQNLIKIIHRYDVRVDTLDEVMIRDIWRIPHLHGIRERYRFH
ncbi:uncharacterized protein LOC101458311 isoform X2 [Ceratitis capitata]|uniref:uncharacterized protein LOC101458311 isoform X2 n=1 Tax=Ceratitis capitata TaxID=7213 RepID=UPI000A112990|nr:uncharacterized protein LOC101458311 isoform X2 [Ceratitis capitata]